MNGRGDMDWPVHRPSLLNRATRVLRLLTWAMTLACAALAFWILASVAAHAEDPKAAARAIGQAGTAAAGAIARDASRAGTVPGYAGTDVPERGLDGLRHAGRGEGAARRP